MQTIEATCPICKATNEFGPELIGRYTLCPSCRGRFYIEVPPLAESQAGSAIPGSPLVVEPGVKPDKTTLDDLLWDTQQGTRYLIQALWRLESHAETSRRLQIAMVLLMLANLVALAILCLR